MVARVVLQNGAIGAAAYLSMLTAAVVGVKAQQQCNVSATKPELPCNRLRCRHKIGRGGRNWTERGLHYHESLINRFITDWEDYQGFLGFETAYFVHLLSTFQSDMGIFGAVGEIGVAAGKSFATLAFTRRSGEPLFVCDIFAGGDAHKRGVEIESDNVAIANLPMFFDTLVYAGINPRDVIIHDGPSFELTDTYLMSRGTQHFRLFHVDGGHFLEAALHDLRLAACMLAPGGVIMIDDVHNSMFPGVQEAFNRFMLFDRPRLRPHMVPFLIVGGRLYLADRQYAAKYRQRLRDSLPENSFWKTRKFLYGEEVLIPGALRSLEASLRNIVSLEDEFFPWPRTRNMFRNRQEETKLE